MFSVSHCQTSFRRRTKGPICSENMVWPCSSWTVLAGTRLFRTHSDYKKWCEPRTCSENMFPLELYREQVWTPGLSVISDLDSRMLVLHKYNVSIIMLMSFSEHHLSFWLQQAILFLNTQTYIVSWEPEGRYRHRLCTAITPFWFSSDEIWHYIHTCTTVYYAMKGLPIE